MNDPVDPQASGSATTPTEPQPPHESPHTFAGYPPAPPAPGMWPPTPPAWPPGASSPANNTYRPAGAPPPAQTGNSRSPWLWVGLTVVTLLVLGGGGFGIFRLVSRPTAPAPAGGSSPAALPSTAPSAQSASASASAVSNPTPSDTASAVPSSPLILGSKVYANTLTASDPNSGDVDVKGNGRTVGTLGTEGLTVTVDPAQTTDVFVGNSAIGPDRIAEVAVDVTGSSKAGYGLACGGIDGDGAIFFLANLAGDWEIAQSSNGSLKVLKSGSYQPQSGNSILMDAGCVLDKAHHAAQLALAVDKQRVAVFEQPGVPLSSALNIETAGLGATGSGTFHSLSVYNASLAP